MSRVASPEPVAARPLAHSGHENEQGRRTVFPESYGEEHVHHHGRHEDGVDHHLHGVDHHHGEHHVSKASASHHHVVTEHGGDYHDVHGGRRDDPRREGAHDEDHDDHDRAKLGKHPPKEHHPKVKHQEPVSEKEDRPPAHHEDHVHAGGHVAHDHPPHHDPAKYGGKHPPKAEHHEPVGESSAPLSAAGDPSPAAEAKHPATPGKNKGKGKHPVKVQVVKDGKSKSASKSPKFKGKHRMEKPKGGKPDDHAVLFSREPDSSGSSWGNPPAESANSSSGHFSLSGRRSVSSGTSSSSQVPTVGVPPSRAGSRMSGASSQESSRRRAAGGKGVFAASLGERSSGEQMSHSSSRPPTEVVGEEDVRGIRLAEGPAAARKSWWGGWFYSEQPSKSGDSLLDESSVSVARGSGPGGSSKSARDGTMLRGPSPDLAALSDKLRTDLASLRDNLSALQENANNCSRTGVHRYHHRLSASSSSHRLERNPDFFAPRSLTSSRARRGPAASRSAKSLFDIEREGSHRASKSFETDSYHGGSGTEDSAASVVFEIPARSGRGLTRPRSAARGADESREERKAKALEELRSARAEFHELRDLKELRKRRKEDKRKKTSKEAGRGRSGEKRLPPNTISSDNALLEIVGVLGSRVETAQLKMLDMVANIKRERANRARMLYYEGGHHAMAEGGQGSEHEHHGAAAHAHHGEHHSGDLHSGVHGATAEQHAHHHATAEQYAHHHATGEQHAHHHELGSAGHAHHEHGSAGHSHHEPVGSAVRAQDGSAGRSGGGSAAGQSIPHPGSSLHSGTTHAATHGSASQHSAPHEHTGHASHPDGQQPHHQSGDQSSGHRSLPSQPPSGGSSHRKANSSRPPSHHHEHDPHHGSSHHSDPHNGGAHHHGHHGRHPHHDDTAAEDRFTSRAAGMLQSLHNEIVHSLNALSQSELDFDFEKSSSKVRWEAIFAEELDRLENGFETQAESLHRQERAELDAIEREEQQYAQQLYDIDAANEERRKKAETAGIPENELDAYEAEEEREREERRERGRVARAISSPKSGAGGPQRSRSCGPLEPLREDEELVVEGSHQSTRPEGGTGRAGAGASGARGNSRGAGAAKPKVPGSGRAATPGRGKNVNGASLGTARSKSSSGGLTRKPAPPEHLYKKSGIHDDYTYRPKVPQARANTATFLNDEPSASRVEKFASKGRSQSAREISNTRTGTPAVAKAAPANEADEGLELETLTTPQLEHFAQHGVHADDAGVPSQTLYEEEDDPDVDDGPPDTEASAILKTHRTKFARSERAKAIQSTNSKSHREQMLNDKLSHIRTQKVKEKFAPLRAAVVDKFDERRKALLDRHEREIEAISRRGQQHASFVKAAVEYDLKQLWQRREEDKVGVPSWDVGLGTLVIGGVTSKIDLSRLYSRILENDSVPTLRINQDPSCGLDFHRRRRMAAKGSAERCRVEIGQSVGWVVAISCEIAKRLEVGLSPSRCPLYLTPSRS